MYCYIEYCSRTQLKWPKTIYSHRPDADLRYHIRLLFWDWSPLFSHHGLILLFIINESHYIWWLSVIILLFAQLMRCHFIICHSAIMSAIRLPFQSSSGFIILLDIGIFDILLRGAPCCHRRFYHWYIREPSFMYRYMVSEMKKFRLHCLKITILSAPCRWHFRSLRATRQRCMRR